MSSRGGTITSTVNYEELANILNRKMKNREGGNNQRLAIMLGMLTKDSENPVQVNIPEKDRSNFSLERYKFMLEAPFEISNKCCDVMKKRPASESKLKPITAQMAAESRLRTQKWLQHGCNMFDAKKPKSNPMSFWTEQDVLLYIVQNNLEIASVYGDIVKDYGKIGQVEGQISLDELGLFENERPLLKCTGCKRTGCIICGFGAHLEKKGEGRFERLAVTHPKIFDFAMRGGSFEDGLFKPDDRGLGYWFVISWINKYGNFNIQIPNMDKYVEEYSTDETRKYLD